MAVYYKMFPGCVISSSEHSEAISGSLKGHFQTMSQEERDNSVLHLQTEEVRKKRGQAVSDHWAGLSDREVESRLRNSVNSESARLQANESLRQTWDGFSFEERQDRTEQMNTEEANRKKGEAAEAWWAGFTLEEKETKLKEGINSEKSRAKAEESLRRFYSTLSEGEKSERTSQMRTEGALEALSQAQKRVWAKRSLKEKQRLMGNLTKAAIVGTEPTRPEKCLEEFLDRHYPGMFKLNHRGDIRIGRRYPDFISTNGRKIVIESFGTPWHTYSRTEDEIVSEYREFGYNCIVVWANYEEDIIFEWPNIVRQIDSIGI